MRMRDSMTEKMISSLFSSRSMSDDEAEKTLIEEPQVQMLFRLLLPPQTSLLVRYLSEMKRWNDCNFYRRRH